MERKPFFANQSINILHHNDGNMIVVPITKRMEIIISVQGCLFLQMTFDYKENGRKKAFLANPMHQYRVSQYGEHDCRANNKMNGDYYMYPSLSPFLNKP